MSSRRDSEFEDEPDPFQSSGEEWDLEKAKMEESGRRKSSRLSRKPMRSVIDEGSDDSSSDEEFVEEYAKTKQRNGSNKKRKPNENTESEQVSVKKEKNSRSNNSSPCLSDSSSKANSIHSETSSKANSIRSENSSNVYSNRGSNSRKFIPKTIYSEDYATGSFVISKKDAQGSDPKSHPCIWRIDGKALLQKYEAIDEGDKVRHKNTSIYTGWSPMDKDFYAPVTVDVIRHNSSNLVVELHWDKLANINTDSE